MSRIDTDDVTIDVSELTDSLPDDIFDGFDPDDEFDDVEEDDVEDEEDDDCLAYLSRSKRRGSWSEEESEIEY
jgi:hypothetical protein